MIFCAGRDTRRWTLPPQNRTRRYIGLCEGRRLFCDTMSRGMRVLSLPQEKSTILRKDDDMTRPVVVRTEFHRRLHRPGEDSPFRLARAIVPLA